MHRNLMSPLDMDNALAVSVYDLVQDTVQEAMTDTVHQTVETAVWWVVWKNVHEAVTRPETMAVRRPDHSNLDRFIEEIEQKWGAEWTTR